MLTEICQHIRNWFDRDMPKYYGEFSVVDGQINLSACDIKEGQYFRIIGSVFNDGVHRYPAFDLTDEVFEGAVWAMAVPPAVIALAGEIQAWNDTYSDTLKSPYTSESFGGYSYSKASGTNGDGTITWKDSFKSRLDLWRKIR